MFGLEQSYHKELMLFGKNWFIKHQKIIRWFANTFIGKWFFRIDHKGRIDTIMPNYIAWWDGDNITKEFRTHNKYSKRMLYGLYPVWWLIHQWDTLFANNFKPTWNLGFDVLTAYPDADTETTTVDGEVNRSNAGDTWAQMRGGAGSAALPSQNTGRTTISYHNPTGGWDSFRRFIHLYDTSSLGVGATISSATISFCSSSTNDDFGSSTVTACSSNPDSNTDLTTADYAIGDFGGTSFGTIAISSITTDSATYNDISLNASGLANITQDGVSKFAYMDGRDFSDSDPGGTTTRYSNCTILSADQAGTTKDPKLVVNYTPGVTFTPKVIII